MSEHDPPWWSGPTLGRALLDAEAPREATVRIPELRNIVMTSQLQALVDHPAFQRLRQVRQLGPTHLVYPGAVHTRFEHSLGVFGCVQWFIRSLMRHEAVRLSLTEQDLLTVLAAGLLHDLGHYPFAHSLEALHLKGRDAPRHEEVGAQIIFGEVASLRGERTLEALLRDQWGVDPHRVVALCTGDLGAAPSAVDKLLRSIISGAIDADKMDYLERDSHHMGVPYGRHYDRQRLLASLTLNRAQDSIALEAKGKVSAEMFIFSRYTMFSEAYWHHTVRAASAMVEAALADYTLHAQLAPQALLEVLLSHDDDGLLRWLHAQSVARAQARALTGGLVGYQRQLYKRVLTFSRAAPAPQTRRAYALLHAMDAPTLSALMANLRATLSERIGQPIDAAALILDTPPRDKDRLETIAIVSQGGGSPWEAPLHELSSVVAGVHADFAGVVKKIRLFATPTLSPTLRALPELEALVLEAIFASCDEGVTTGGCVNSN